MTVTLTEIEARSAQVDHDAGDGDVVFENDYSDLWVVEVRISAPSGEAVAYGATTFAGRPEVGPAVIGAVEEVIESLYEAAKQVELGLAMSGA